MSTEELLTARDVAARVRRTTRTVNRWIDDGHLPVIQIGPARYVRADTLDRMLADERALVDE